MGSFLRDLRYGVRTLANNPGFTVVAVAVLAVGIGANIAIFSVANSVLLKPLPYKDPERLVMVYERREEGGTKQVVPFTPPHFPIFERETRLLEEVAAFRNWTYELAERAGTTESERIVGTRVSPSLFSMLGAEPVLGRTFTSEENHPDRRVVVLSYGLWQRRFGADKNILGESMTLDRQPYTVIGVMAPGFAFPPRGLRQYLTESQESPNGPADLWLPLAFTPLELEGRGNFTFNVVGRLRPNVTLEQVRSEAGVIAEHIFETYPQRVRDDPRVGLSSAVEPFHSVVVGEVRTPLLVLWVAVMMVLLIASVNVANLLLTHASARHHEMVVRVAVGATRRRLITQVLTESLLLALLGGGLGLLLALWAMEGLAAIVPITLLRAAEIGIDQGVLLFSLLLCVGTAILFGLAPALQSAKTDCGEALKEGGRGLGLAPGRHRVLRFLVISQIAVALVLLVSAGLFLRSFLSLQEADPGFQAEQVLAITLALPETSYPGGEQIHSFYQALLVRVEVLPGVKTVGASTDLPLEISRYRGFTIEGRLSEGSKIAGYIEVLGDYFETLETSLKSGRYFTERDRSGAEPVIIINETLERRWWSGEDPLGKRLELREGTRRWRKIVGVIEDVKNGPLHTESLPQYFLPYPQGSGGRNTPTTRGGPGRIMTLLVRTEMDPSTLVAAVRGEIGELDPLLPVTDVQTLTQHLSRSVAPQRFNTLLLALFAAVALFLAVVGIYGVMSYVVTQRSHELGIRMALGAERNSLLRLVIGQGMTLALWGVAIGLVASFALTRLIASQLYGVTATDPMTLVGAALLFFAVALLACVVPGLKATRVDPMVALRYE